MASSLFAPDKTDGFYATRSVWIPKPLIIIFGEPRLLTPDLGHSVE